MDIISFVLSRKGIRNVITKISKLVTHYDNATEDTMIAYKPTGREIEIPTMDDLNEVKLVAEGAHQAVSFENYSEFITSFNAESKDKHNIGQNIYIVTEGVPDLWVQSIAEVSRPYTYTTDNTIVNALNTTGYIQVGYYIIGHLETQKIDLENYVKFSDHATAIKEGTIKLGNGFNALNGTPMASTLTSYTQYQSAPNAEFIGKGTLENIKEDYVKSALTSLEQDEYSEEEQSNVNALIGSVPKSAFVYDPDTETLSISLI